ncbi:Uncharacterized protein FWK35_00018592 [Aphis craccivora]|uniref:Uncharacterized protein n=1 Tax=Aphis craccivora TaxID=307492 RepID=A0A6G0YQ01_APHCR|nr:Uncharacterized protein FWK35_00018592 [Aphis craccivora]
MVRSFRHGCRASSSVVIWWLIRKAQELRLGRSLGRIECDFNHIKNLVFKYENMPLMIYTFLQKLISYYRGKINACETIIDELEETNDKLLFHDETKGNYEYNIHVTYTCLIITTLGPKDLSLYYADWKPITSRYFKWTNVVKPLYDRMEIEEKQLNDETLKINNAKFKTPQLKLNNFITFYLVQAHKEETLLMI